jgi:hypothetical protein
MSAIGMCCRYLMQSTLPLAPAGEEEEEEDDDDDAAAAAAAAAADDDDDDEADFVSPLVLYKRTTRA